MYPPLFRPESVIAVVSHCGFLVHGMRALGKSMFHTWSDAMLLQYQANHSSSSNSSGILIAANPLQPPNGTTPAVGIVAGAGPAGFTPLLSSFGPAGVPPAANHPYSPPALLNTNLEPVVPPHDHHHRDHSTNRGTHQHSPEPQFSPQGVSFGPQSAAFASTPVSQAAESLRQSAADLTGWFSADWANCECRSIQLSLGHTSDVLTGPLAQQQAADAAAAEAAAAAAAGAGAAGVDGKGSSGEGVSSSVAPGQFLWATPGDALTYFPGGSYGLMQ